MKALRSPLVATAVALAALAALPVVAVIARGIAPDAAQTWTHLAQSVLGDYIANTLLLVVLVGAVDRWLASTLQRLTGESPGLLLTGTVIALLYAYLVRYFAVAWNGIEPGFARITPAMDAASRSLGASVTRTLRDVHAPLLARSVAAAFLLVFVDVMKELPATLVMRPFNFDTLATQTFQFARDERLEEAALPSLAIVVVGLLPIALLAGTALGMRRAATAAAAPAT